MYMLKENVAANLHCDNVGLLEAMAIAGKLRHADCVHVYVGGVRKWITF